MTTSYPERPPRPQQEHPEACTPPALQVTGRGAEPRYRVVCRAQARWRRAAARPGQPRDKPLRAAAPRGLQGPAAVAAGGGKARASLEINHSESQAHVWQSRGRAATQRHKQRPGQPTSPASQPDHSARQHNPATQPSNTNARQPAGPPRVRHTGLAHSWHRGTGHTSPRHRRARQAAEDRAISAGAQPPPRRPGQR